MADFLASFKFGAQPAAPVRDDRCASIEELVGRLRRLLEDKTAAHESRVEHAAATLELRNTVHFTLTLTDAENEAIEGLGQVDPSLGGLRLTSASVDAGDGHRTRTVDANDTLMAQSNNNVLQRAVAKHIINAASSADGSSWSLRDMKLGDKGWAFKYACKDSLREWERQNEKKPSKPVIGEFSFKEPDPVLSGRPAFDCRGSVTVTFDRSRRSIVITYDHTLLHKTVDQLIQLYPPPERQLGPGALRLQEQKAQQQKTPKKKSSERKRKPESASKENGGEKRPRKRKKKNDTASDPAATANGETSASGDASGQPSHGESDGQPADGSSQSASGGLTFNVSPEEAKRRLATARKLLSDAGVSPDSLSADQMNIFANQSPELQKDSVAMLSKYGAERLQIVVPSDKDRSTSEGPGTSAGGRAAAKSGAASTTRTELIPATQASESPALPPQTTGNDDDDGSANGGESTSKSKSKSKTKKMGKSRLACSACKQRKTKCPKERPTCAECVLTNSVCEYPPPKPRKKKSEAVVTVDDEEGEEEEDADEDEDDDTQVQQQLQNEQPAVQHPNSIYPLPPQNHSYDMSGSAQMPVANMLTPSTEQPLSDGNSFPPSAFQSTSGLVLPTGQMNHSPALDTNQISATSLGAEARDLDESARRTRVGGRIALPAQAPSGTQSWASVNRESVAETTSNSSPGFTSLNAARLGQRQSQQRLAAGSPEPRDSGTRRSASRASNQSPNLATVTSATQAPMPSTTPDNWRSNSRQSLRSSQRNASGDQSSMSAFRPPASQPPARTDSRGSGASNLMAPSTYNSYGRYDQGDAAAADSSSARIAYQPYSQPQQSQQQQQEQQSHTTASTVPGYTSYDYGHAQEQQNYSAASNVPAYTSYDYGQTTNNAMPNLKPPASMGMSSYSSDNLAAGDHSQPVSSQRNYQVQSGSTTARPRSRGPGKQQQQNNYSQYPSQQTQRKSQGQGMNQQQPSDWYNFNHGANSSFAPPGSSNWI